MERRKRKEIKERKKERKKKRRFCKLKIWESVSNNGFEDFAK